MLNIDNHIINYKRNTVANFCQINNYIYIYIYIYIIYYIYIFLFKTNQTILCLSKEITKQQKLYYFKNEKCTFVNKI